MHSKNTYSPIFDSIYSVSELQYFYKEIDQILSDIFRSSQDFESVLNSTVSIEKKELLLSYLHEIGADIKNPVSIQEALLKLKKEGNSIPVVNLTLAFEPTSQTLKTISLWFLRRLQKKVLLNIILERSILGGTFISYEGSYKDYTLKTKLDKYFDTHKKELEQETQIPAA